MNDLLTEIDCLFFELCRLADAAPTTPMLLRRASWVNDRLVHGQLEGACRVINLAGSLGDMALARAVTAETRAWAEGFKPLLMAVVSGRLSDSLDEPNPVVEQLLESSLDPLRRLVQVQLDTRLGDAEDASGHYDNAKRLFDSAAELSEPFGDERVLELRCKSANQVARLRRHGEARAAYEGVLGAAESAGFDRIAIAARFGIVGCRWRQGERDRVLEDQLGISAALERMFLEAPRDGWARAMLLSAYRLLVNIVASDRATLIDHLPVLLRALYSIRTPHAVAALDQVDHNPRHSAAFEVDLLLSRWKAVEGAVLLVWETGADDMVLTTIASGYTPIAERVDVACIPNDRAGALIECIRETRDASEQLSTRAIGLRRSSSTRMEEAMRAAWCLLPATTANMLLAADTIVYSPSSQSILDEFPLEALHDGEAFLGTKKVISRIPSLQHLTTQLAPNRYRQSPPSRALLVRAKDPERTEDDETVREQANLIAASVRGLDLELEELKEPTLSEFDEGTKAARALLHFVGHGFAGEGGEALILSETEAVPIASVVTKKGVRAPFTYFSACEVGRSRQMSSGAQRGLAATFLNAGAPAVLAPAYRVPSHFLGQLAATFYQHASEEPAGRALQRTRAQLHKHGYHPACWATLSMFGDPFSALTTRAEHRCPAHPTPWSSLVFQQLATQDEGRKQACLEGMKADFRLDAPTRSAIVQWLSEQSGGPEDAGAILDGLQRVDVEAAATLQILCTLQDVKGVNTDSPKEEQEAARERLDRCLMLAAALDDSYASICVIEGLGRIGIPMNEMGRYRQLLDHEQMFMEMLSDDAQALARIAGPLSELRERMETMTFVNIGTRFDYSDDDVQRADDGDPGALRRMALSMMEGSAQPEALAGVLPWYVWMFRWGGSGTSTDGGNVLAALRIDVRARRLTQLQATAIRDLVGELEFASNVYPNAGKVALEAFAPGGLEHQVLELMLLRDAIRIRSPVTLPEVHAAVLLADQVGTQLGRTGFAAWMRSVLAQTYRAHGEGTRAKVFAMEAVEELEELQPVRRELTTRLEEAVQFAISECAMAGDFENAARLAREHADVLARIATREQEVPDAHGHLADYLDDFRTGPESSGEN
ncbi:MAG: CHAT domain-containing protein [Myxococcota bacterium]